ncbi:MULTISPECIES: hypothetical protein [unclassified Frankia]
MLYQLSYTHQNLAAMPKEDTRPDRRSSDRCESGMFHPRRLTKRSYRTGPRHRMGKGVTPVMLAALTALAALAEITARSGGRWKIPR